MHHLARLRSELTHHVRATLNGCAQLAFCDTPLAGLLVLGGIALASPFAGGGALLGATFGTIVGRHVPAYSRVEWSFGLASFNPAIVGLFFGGFLASGERGIAFLIPYLAAAVLLDVGLRRVLARIMLPSLSLAAVATLYIVSALEAPPGGWFWTDAPASPLMPLGALGALSIVAAIVMKSRPAGLLALSLGAVTLLAGWLLGEDSRATFGLWAITVPLASFGMHAVFLRGSFVGGVAGTLAALIGALVWIAWEASSLQHWVPPLLLPFILGMWLSMLLIRRVMASPMAGPAFWRAMRAVLAARAAGREAVAVLAPGTTAEGGPSVPLDSAWHGAEVPRFAFERETLRASLRCRKEFWEGCARLKEAAEPARAEVVARWLERLQRRGWIQRTVVGDASHPWSALTEGVLRVHGDVRITRCMDCGTEASWPPRRAWRHYDLRCSGCAGPIIPAVTLPGARADEAVVAELQELAARCATPIIFGDPAGEPEIRGFLGRARDTGATAIFVSELPENDGRAPDDICVRMPAERFLAWTVRVAASCDAIARLGFGQGATPRLRSIGGKRRHKVAG